MKLHYVIGDATSPILSPALICHVANNLGAWGSGFVIALSRKNKEPERAYLYWYRECDERGEKLPLGAIQITSFTRDGVQVASMVAQKGIRPTPGQPALQYDALRACLKSAYHYAENNKMTVHMPRIGAVRGGGDWAEIEKIIQETMTVETYIYTLPGEKDQWPTSYEDIPGENVDLKDIDFNNLNEDEDQHRAYC